MSELGNKMRELAFYVDCPPLIALAADADKVAELEASAFNLYVALACCDTRDGSLLAEVVRTAREGYERAGMGEAGAWDEFEYARRLFNEARLSPSQVSTQGEQDG